MRRSICPGLALVMMLGAALPAQAQQRIERFPEAGAPAPPAVVSLDERSSYWLEGAVIGAATGIAAGVTMIDASGTCPTLPGADCSEDYVPVIIGSFLLGVFGGALGGMIGATIARE